jgi:hypothetical protein
MRRRTKIALWAGAVAVVATLVATVVFLNLSSGDPGIQRPSSPLRRIGRR